MNSIMEKANVFNLIKKFEQLSTEMTKQRPVIVRQKSIKNVDKEDVEMEIKHLIQNAAIKPETKTWTNNPLTAIEGRISVLKRNIDDLQRGDKQEMLLGLFMEMLDLLIQLSTIDTDGLKAMKLKKDSYLAELKSLKTTITEFILTERNGVTEIEQPVVERQVLANGNDQYDDDDGDEEDEENNVVYAENRSEMIFPDVKLGSVQSLTQKFENNQSCGLNSRKILVETDNSQPTSIQLYSDQMHSELIDKNKEELNDEIEYYKHLVSELDPDDFLRIETVKEYMLELKGVIENHPEAEQEIDVVLNQIEALKSKDDSTVQMIEKEVVPAEAESPTNETSCNQGFSGMQLLDVPQIEVSKDIDRDDTNSKSDQLSSSAASSIQVLEINIPGEHENVVIDNDLAISLRTFAKYKQLITTYLEASVDISEFEEEIQEHYNALTQFTPHETVHGQFQELCDRYKEILDLITESNFAKAYQQAINSKADDENGIENDVEVLDTMAYFNGLIAEIGNYHHLIATLNPADRVRANVIGEDLREIISEIGKCDVSMDHDLKCKQTSTLHELSELQIKLAAKCKPVT